MVVPGHRFWLPQITCSNMVIVLWSFHSNKNETKKVINQGALKMYWDCWVLRHTPLILIFVRKKLADSFVFQPSLVYIASSRPQHTMRLCLQKRKNKTKQGNNNNNKNPTLVRQSGRQATAKQGNLLQASDDMMTSNDILTLWAGDYHRDVMWSTEAAVNACEAHYSQPVSQSALSNLQQVFLFTGNFSLPII